jgi:HlyD family secretion protein
MRRMGIKVSVQESQIKKVKVGQKARIVADAEPDKTLTGKVKKVALLPDSNRWYQNPNQKVYPTEVHVDGTHDWLKPGMSVKLEIITDELKEVIKIPLQSVMADSGETVTYVKRGGDPVRQVVETGGFNDEFIEITSGVEEGESVFLSKPFVEEDGKTTGSSTKKTEAAEANSEK